MLPTASSGRRTFPTFRRHAECLQLSSAFPDLQLRLSNKWQFSFELEGARAVQRNATIHCKTPGGAIVRTSEATAYELLFLSLTAGEGDGSPWPSRKARGVDCRHPGCNVPAENDHVRLCLVHRRENDSAPLAVDGLGGALEAANAQKLGGPFVGKAACRDRPDVDFFPEGTAYRSGQKATEAAKAVCASCEARAECLEAGMNEVFGIWGGTTPDERKTLRAQRAA